MSLFDYCAEVEQADELYLQSLLYLSGSLSAFSFQHNVKLYSLPDQLGVSGKDFRLSLLENEFYTVSVKFALMFYGTNSQKVARAKAYEVIGDEVEHFDRVLTRRVITILKKHCKDNGLSAKQVDFQYKHREAYFESMLHDLDRHIKLKVYSKLRFVVKSQNFESSDLYSDILCKALVAYRQLMPTTKAQAYVLNYLRQACTNHALNLIETYTTQKKARIVNNGPDQWGSNSYTYICESENQSSETALDHRGGQYHHDESNIHVAKLIDRFSGWKRKALLVMAGLSRGFTLYLSRMDKIKDHQDHQDFQNKVSHTTYLNYVAKYCGAAKGQFEEFVGNLGFMLREAV